MAADSNWSAGASALVCLAAFLCYWNTLKADFAYDDSRAVLTNADLRPDRPFWNLLFNDFWGTPLTHSGSHKSYRPLCVATFRLNYALGELDPMGYHLVNIVLHAITSLFYFLLVRQLTGWWTALFSALLFATHPVHCESVAGVVGRADVLACLFFLLSLAVYIHCCHADSLALCFLSVVLAGLAMLCKEQGLTVLAVSAVYDVFVASHCPVASIFSILSRTHLSGLRLRLTVLFTSGLSLLFFRVVFMGSKPPDFAPSDNPAADSDSLLTRILTFSYLPAFNAWLLLTPSTLSFDWSMQAIPLLESLSDIRNFVSLVFYFCLFMLADVCLVAVSGMENYTGLVCGKLRSLICLRGKSTDNIAAHSDAHCTLGIKSGGVGAVDSVIMSLSLMVFPFIPAANLLFYVGFVVAERVLYIPSAGFCLLIAVGTEKLWTVASTRSIRKAIIASCVFILLLFAVRTVRRNEDWETEESLYRSGISVNPAKAWGNLANVLKGNSKVDEAEIAYHNALSYRPNMADAHYNLGILLQDAQRYDEAIESYRNAVKFRPSLASAHLNLGIVLEAVKEIKEAEKESVDMYMHAINSLPLDYAPQSLYNMLGQTLVAMGRLQEAEKWYNKALEVKVDHVPALLTLAELHAKTGRSESAKKLFEKAITLRPNSTDSYTHYGQFLHRMGDLSAAAAQFGQAAGLAPDSYDIVYNAGNYYREAKMYENAEEYYRVALKLNPKSAEANMNLGALHHLLSRYEEAEYFYEQALKLHPGDTLTKDNLRKLKQAMQTTEHISV